MSDVDLDEQNPADDDLVAGVSLAQVHALLLGRRPRLLDPNHDDHKTYLDLVSGVVNEVRPLAGAKPGTQRRSLALWAIALGTASQLEFALYPEQQPQTGRGEYLQGRYARILGQLGGRIPGDSEGDDDGDGTDAQSPVASFPPALPDPFLDGALGAAVSPYDWPGHYMPRSGW